MQRKSTEVTRSIYLWSFRTKKLIENTEYNISASNLDRTVMSIIELLWDNLRNWSLQIDPVPTLSLFCDLT